MDNEILVNKNAFEMAIKSISEIVNNMEVIKNSITTANELLKEQWEGKASKVFFSESENIVNTFTDYNEGLSMLAEDLQSIYVGFTEQDNSIATSISELSVNNMAGGQACIVRD